MDNKQFQLLYGIVLIAVGIAVFFKIPHVLPKVAELDYFSGATFIIGSSFYLLGGLLLLAGVKKILKNFKNTEDV